MKDSGRTTIDLKSSVCTDNPTGSDTYPFSADPTQIVQNTGIERNGGVESIYEQETTFTTAGVSTMIAKDGTVVQVDASNNVRLNDTVIGNVGPLAIKNRGVLKGYLDAAWTADETLIAINRIGTSMYVYEINPATGAILHRRSNVFAGFPSGAIANICLIKYVDMHYADNQEFIVQPTRGPGMAIPAYVLRELGTSTTAFVLLPPYMYFGWRFAASKYIYGKEGFDSSISTWWIGDMTTSSTIVEVTGIRPVTNIIIDRFPGTAFSRAILTLPADKFQTMYNGYGEVGYTSAGVYSATPVFYGVAILIGTTVVNAGQVCGMGYSESTFTTSATGTDVFYYYAAPFAHNIAAYYLSAEAGGAGGTGSPSPINGYGKLTDIFNVTSGANVVNTLSWRVVFINGQASFLSAAPVGSTWDCLGVPITNVGEFDETFIPHIDDNGSTYSRVLYRYNGNLFYVNITSTATHTLQKVSDNLYTVNCISPINAIDVRNKKLYSGTTDYNGRLIFGGGAVSMGSTTTFKAVGIVQGDYSNSIDPGDRLENIALVVPGTYLFCPGIEMPNFIDRLNDFEVNLYIADTYSTSFLNYAGSAIDGNLTGRLYVPDTRLPFAMGYQFQERIMQTEVETIFTGVGLTGSADIDFDYLCYELGNDTPDLYQSFVLFGQMFLFDGKQIWFATFTGSLFSGRGSSPVCPATGMQLIASSPTEIYFLSAYDNSLYVFDGGRALKKAKRMNDLRNSSGGIETIINGVFSVRDNSLLMQTASTFVWARDGVFTQNNKKANQTSISLYDTVNGITIANNTLQWIYAFKNIGNTTIVPLTWQSAYHSLKANELSITTAWIVTLFSPEGPLQTQVTLTCYAFDQENYTVQKASVTILPSWWDGLGFVRLRIQPKNEKALASSVQIDYTAHLVITDVSVLYGDEAQAPIASVRSL